MASVPARKALVPRRQVRALTTKSKAVLLFPGGAREVFKRRGEATHPATLFSTQSLIFDTLSRAFRAKRTRDTPPPFSPIRAQYQAYTLQWADKSTLVKVAARYNATIVPFSGVGGDEFFADDPIFDSDELLELPIVGDFFKDRIRSLPSFVDGDVFVPPLVGARPGGPRRNYFIFGEPFSTRDIDPSPEQTRRLLGGGGNFGVGRVFSLFVEREPR